MYLPSFWFHYIMSQDASIQCNARSGDDSIAKEQIRACGFQSTKLHPEQVVAHTIKKPMLRNYAPD